ncbi:MAG TPA: branched-chain amino acid aminotransferase [Nitrospirae bacterium]|nr:D-alanine aminotransferase [bacterium BMS3Abin08]HDY72043.1 branched-chain amino acid aminotransferase [Nitrospirota bacterium]
MLVYLNGNFLSESEAKVPVSDRGFLLGDGLFETMRVYNGYVFKLNEHLRRLQRGCGLLEITIPEGVPGLKIRIYQLIQMNGLKDDGYIRVTVTRGAGGRGLDIRGCDTPTLLITSGEYRPYPDDLYRRGVEVVFSERENLRTNRDCDLKSTNFLNNILARLQSGKKDAFEVVMFNPHGYLSEGTITNIFFITPGTLCTPAPECGILRGITRETVLDICKKRNIPVREGLFRRHDLGKAEEVFITNSLMGVMPVSSIDGRTLRVGEVTGTIITAYRELIDEERRASGNSREDRPHKSETGCCPFRD